MKVAAASRRSFALIHVMYIGTFITDDSLKPLLVELLNSWHEVPHFSMTVLLVDTVEKRHI